MISSGSCFQIFVFSDLSLKTDHLILGNNGWVGEVAGERGIRSMHENEQQYRINP